MSKNHKSSTSGEGTYIVDIHLTTLINWHSTAICCGENYTFIHFVVTKAHKVFYGSIATNAAFAAL